MYQIVSSILLITAMVVSAEPPRRNQFSRQFQRIEQAPYQPSGWKPAGPAFKLPSEPVPHAVYGPPPQTYGPPQQEYGPPVEITTHEPTTTELPTTTQFNEEAETVEPIEGGESQRLQNGQEGGVYYIYHPDGRLQRVVYATKDDVRNMEYFARLRYENVEPIRGPIYTYSPDDLVLRRL
ncbi:uncharacterized protein LOC109600371 [Aethina tumida]|uniref:uncharacterized protein LOC109600371 n=1 Tax=Aethina tumida TaxID=116153 RepID=UPI002148C18A|nr:uncharacterized protein LOC109600371 [Aethina tumida]